MNKTRNDIPFHVTAVAWPALFVLLLAPLLTSCFATTDDLAVYESSVLNKDEINTISGDYHVFEPGGNFSSISFTPRSELWPYRQPVKEPHGTQTPRLLAAANMSLKSVVVLLEDGDKMVWRIDGAAIFSRIPETDLILASVPGETLRVDVGDEAGLTPASEKNKNSNLFFIIKHDGKAMTIKLFSESDKGLKLAFQDIKFSSGLSRSTPSLPTERVLAYLKKNAVTVFDEDDSPTYLRSTPKQKILVEKRIHAAFEQTAAEKKRGKATSASKRGVNESEFKVTVPEESARALREAIFGNTNKSQIKKNKVRPGSIDEGVSGQADQRSVVIPVKQNDPTRINSINGFFAAGRDGITFFKVDNTNSNGVETYRGYEWRRNWFTGYYQRGKYNLRGRWHPDSQQSNHQGWFGGGGCGGWGEENWSYPLKYREETFSGKVVGIWHPSILSTDIPAGREKKAICINRKIDPNTCSIVRCNERADPNRTVNIYFVRSHTEAEWIYEHHF